VSGELFAIGFVLAVAAPFLVTALVVLAVVWLVSRRRRGPAVAAATPAAPPTTDTDAVSSDERLAEPTRQG
jgi:hypothetical protein